MAMRLISADCCVSKRKRDPCAGGQQPEKDRPPKKIEVCSVSPDPIVKVAYRAYGECILSPLEFAAARVWPPAVEQHNRSRGPPFLRLNRALKN